MNLRLAKLAYHLSISSESKLPVLLTGLLAMLISKIPVTPDESLSVTEIFTSCALAPCNNYIYL